MTFQTYKTDENGNTEELKCRIYCSCCGKDVTDDEDGFFSTEFVKNHTTNETIIKPVLCNSCAEWAFRY